MFVEKLGHNKWLITAFIILLANITAYQLSFIDTLSVEQVRGMVVGSLVDCAIVAPALVLLHTRNWSIKRAIIFAAGGIVIARIIIPTSFIEPFRYLTWSAFAVEACLIAFELMLLIIVVRYVPTIINTVKGQHEQLLFAFPRLVAEKAKGNPIIQVLASEMLVFYYACLSWRKKPDTEGYTVYKNTMYIPMLIMIFHAATFEAVAFHWFFHDRMPILAWGHTILSIYGIIFLIADARALILNPTKVDGQKLYLSNGLMKRTNFYVGHIEAIHNELDLDEVYHMKVLGNTDEKPAFVLEFTVLQTIHFVGGFEKKVKYLGVYADDAHGLRKQLESYM
ncbi:hypothetical protein [Solibacillus daqui]|uniref:hypothetical protein n=1 Tax=Solibacillus daqui TaxID=2912187 RepID=UPI002366DCD3|nr:hypothetical protein [Solibacillus daqui]